MKTLIRVELASVKYNLEAKSLTETAVDEFVMDVAVTERVVPATLISVGGYRFSGKAARLGQCRPGREFLESL
jgi:hypothetical protein